jgi:hypothetical protein
VDGPRQPRGWPAIRWPAPWLRSAQVDEAEHLAFAFAEGFDRIAEGGDPTLVSLAGALWLISAIVATTAT